MSCVPCETCGKTTPYSGTKRCDLCWTVERNLPDYLKSAGGRAFAQSLLRAADPSAPISDPRKVYLLQYCEEVISGRCQKIVGVFNEKKAAHQHIVDICATPESRRAFWDAFGHPHPDHVTTDNFWVEAFELQRGEPLLDDWAGGKPDAWDYEAVLAANEVKVEWWHELTGDGETFTEAPPEFCGWGFSWKYGAIDIGQTSEGIARKAAALFVSLWKLGVSASFCDKLMDGYISFLERQGSEALTFLAEITHYSHGGAFFRLTRENFCTSESFEYAEKHIIQALGLVAEDEEIVVTFTKRKSAWSRDGLGPTKDPGGPNRLQRQAR
jgi:hypothetical protein